MILMKSSTKSARSADIGFDWKLTDIGKLDGPRYVTTFACGGGSSMGYRLAGWQPLGFVDVDPRMANLYRHNLGTGADVVGDIRKLVNDPNLIPDAWRKADIVDGSPPCTVFSSERNNRGQIGKAKKYAEGAITQRLDDLFCWYLRLVGLLRPRVFVAENVIGMLIPRNRGYVLDICKQAREYGYSLQILKLNAASHGCAQIRQRVFFVGSQSGEKLPAMPKRKLVAVRDVMRDVGRSRGGVRYLKGRFLAGYKEAALGAKVGCRGTRMRLHPSKISRALLATRRAGPFHWDEPRFLTYDECARLQSFPDDYDFLDQCGQYVCGMSVPPFLARDLALAITQTYF